MYHSKKIIFLVPYPLGEAPSQRFRFEQYLAHLQGKSYKITFLSFFNQSTWKILYSKGNTLYKAFLFFFLLIKRWTHLPATLSGDFVFIHREVFPIGPPIAEWIIAKVFRKKIIYDFDDAIWLTDKVEETKFQQLLRWRKKVSTICKWSYKVSCGNEYLRTYAEIFNPNAILNPTTIDTQHLHNPTRFDSAKDSQRIIIGWTGSHSTLKYLYPLEGVINKIQELFKNVDLLVIANHPPSLKVNRLIYKPWTSESEISDLLLADIGIMPLPNDEWVKGKCGFKALQYMALEIPAVVSAVGANPKIVTDEKDGYLCHNESEWMTALEKLIMDAPLRKKMGKGGRQKVMNNYSISSNTANFLSLFE